MKSRNSLLIATAWLAATAAHADSATLTVTGTVTPSACAISLGNGGTVSIGALTTGTVKTFPSYNGGYIPPSLPISLSVTCDAPVPLALSWQDNRATTLAPVDPGDGAYHFGLGMAGANKIGAYSIIFSNLKIASATRGPLTAPAGYLTRQTASTGAWSDPTGSETVYFRPDYELGFKVTGSETTPAAISTISGDLTVGPMLAMTLIDTTTSLITLDGSATVTLLYI